MKTTRLSALAFIFGGVFLSGCLNLTRPATAVQSHGLALEVTSSAQVQVNGPRFQINHGELELAGTIAKKPGASTTAFSHLDILFYDQAGTVVLDKPIHFSPQSLGHSRHGGRVGYYSLKLEPLPQSVTRIEVRAHDGSIAAPHS
ncbi:MAG TPA: hypothetical protein VG838_06860 [Opitutaceae bacterium]|nr:hypothetical protein [Lacunisphaera sp.]HWA09151.1 hypothetical protein [Opitutaceae bacterium]